MLHFKYIYRTIRAHHITCICMMTFLYILDLFFYFRHHRVRDYWLISNYKRNVQYEPCVLKIYWNRNRHILFFHSCNNSNFNHLNPLETYILVVAALNFRSDYQLRTHQWTERGNFDFSDPLVAFINVTIDHYIHSSLY